VRHMNTTGRPWRTGASWMPVALGWYVCLSWMSSAQAQTAGVTYPAQARLQTAAVRYQAIDEKGGWAPVPPGRTLELGVEDPRIPLLRRHLVMVGDLPEAATEGTRFDPALEIAVKRFQARHGLPVDGRVGGATYRELNVPAGQRVAQIAANLARWREVPADLPPRRLEINIPTSELALFEAGTQIAGMRVIVGTSENPTPLLQSRITAVVFNPPWNIPASIVRKEILPRLSRDPGYLRQNDIRINDRPSDPYGEQINWASPDRPRALQLQQQPGPKNPLGRIKFDIPNMHAVYLHDTPNKAAFQRSARALSHGCIRLQHPESLARYVLREQLRDDPNLMDRALANPQTTLVRVGTSLPVFIFYWTAFVTADNQVNFRPDFYGQDTHAEPLPAAAATAEPEPIITAEGPACAGRAPAG